MISRRTVLRTLAAAALGAPLTCIAQKKAAQTFRLGFLDAGTSTGRRPLIENLIFELQPLNYMQGKNLVVERRFAEGDYKRLAPLAEELVKLNPDVIVTSGTPATLAVINATATIPIVMANTGDAVRSGLIKSLARPGGNVTGTTIYSPELMAKRLELLKEALPQSRRVAALLNPNNPAQALSWQAIETAARVVNVEVQKFEVRDAQGLETAFAEMVRQGVDGVVIAVDTLFSTNVKTIVELAARHRLAAIGPGQFAQAGLLMTYGIMPAETVRRVAYFVDRILKGAKPADLPAELPTRFELIVNLKTAKALGVTVASSVLTRADKVVE